MRGGKARHFACPQCGYHRRDHGSVCPRDGYPMRLQANSYRPPRLGSNRMKKFLRIMQQGKMPIESSRARQWYHSKPIPPFWSVTGWRPWGGDKHSPDGARTVLTGAERRILRRKP